MDREFITRNHIVERYIGGRMPVSGALDFERFCHEHPELIDEIRLTDRISAAVRLLDASGRAAPWEERARRWWERLPVLIGTAALALVLAAACVVLQDRLGARERSLASLQQRATSQPLDPAKSTRAITVIPSRTGPSRNSLVTIGGREAQMADLKFDLSWSQFTTFRVTIDRVDQGRVGVLHNVQRDSNGNLHIELNSTALGPGNYQLTIEGLSWRGEPEPQAWTTISFAR
ncbi:MAG: hypothetical protein ACHQDD_01005 [Steroidobacterales bacterium]